MEPGTYEHWVHRNERWPLFQGIFHTFPDKDSINLKDLYVKHPTKPNLWAFKGRSDDLVVLSNGYKITPLETEAFVTTHPAINGCLLVSHNQILWMQMAEVTDHNVLHRLDQGNLKPPYLLSCRAQSSKQMNCWTAYGQ